MIAPNNVNDNAFHDFLTTFHPHKINIAMFRAAHTHITDDACPEHLRDLLIGEDWENRFIAAVQQLVKGGKAIWDVDGSTFSMIDRPSEDSGMERKSPFFAAAIIAFACVVITGQPIIDMIDQMNLCRDRALNGLRENDGDGGIWIPILCSLGYGYDSRGEHNDALKVWMNAMKTDSGCWTAKSNLGLLYAIHGTTDDAFEKAIFLI